MNTDKLRAQSLAADIAMAKTELQLVKLELNSLYGKDLDAELVRFKTLAARVQELKKIIKGTE